VLEGHLLRGRIPPIAALRHELRVSEALHHYRPRSCDALPRFTTEIDALSEVRPWSDH